MNRESKTKCPCGSSKDYENCCKVIISGLRPAITAEELMRSRYSAYCTKEIDYILATHDPKTRTDSYSDIAQWADSVQWTGLEILTTEKGKQQDVTGTVHFKAHYIQNGQPELLQENSTFRKEGEQWYYVSGVHNQPIVLPNSSIGRNEPCPCGSGKKFKKCCIKLRTGN